MSALINVKADFGAQGDGSTDDTAAMKAAHATGRQIFYPQGDYKFTPFGFSRGGISGEGQNQTRLIPCDGGNLDCITFDGTNDSSPLFENFQMVTASPRLGGAGIAIAPSSSENEFARFCNVRFYTLPTGIDFKRASHWSVEGCYFNEYSVAGIKVANQENSDSGDSAISNCTFNTTPTGTVGVFQTSSGGLKITNSKFLGGSFGYQFSLDSASTSDILISNCSIETLLAGIYFNRTKGVGGLNFVSVTGCEIGGGTYGIASDVSLPLRGLSISGNNIVDVGGEGHFGIYVGQVTNWSVVGNVMTGGGAGDIGITSTSLASNGIVGGNVYGGWTTNKALGPSVVQF